MKKQYIVLDEKDIPTAELMKLEKTKGVFIECPCCGKLVRLMRTTPLAQQSSESTTGEKHENS